MLDFPASPAVGNEYAVTGRGWRWDGVAWVVIAPAEQRMRWRGPWVAGSYLKNDTVSDGEWLATANKNTSARPVTNDVPSPDWDILVAPPEGASVIVDDVAPPAPEPGDLWYSTVAPVGLFVWVDDGNSSQWVTATGGGSDGTGLPPNAAGFLNNNGTGTLTWQPAGGSDLPPDAAGFLNNDGTGVLSWQPAGGGGGDFLPLDGSEPMTGPIRIEVPDSSKVLDLFATTGAVDCKNWRVSINFGGLDINPFADNGTQQTGLFSLSRTASGITDFRFLNTGTATTLPATTSVVTRQRGDARYLQLIGGQLTGSVTIQETAPYLQLRAGTPSTSYGAVRLVADTGTRFEIRAANNTATASAALSFILRSGSTGQATQHGFMISAVIAAAVYSSDNTLGFDNEIVTRLKGDTRYALASSDAALKEDIVEMGSVEHIIAGLEPVNFHWIANESDPKPEGMQYGLIAQDVETVLPSAVRGEDGSKTLDALTLIGVLVKAVQEQQARIEALEARLGT